MRGIPVGTALALGAVPVVDGVASVALTQEALAATDQQRRDLAAQLTWTLTGVPDVSAVQLLVNGEPYDVPGGAPTAMDRAVWQSQAPGSLPGAGPGQQPHFLLDGAAVVRVSNVTRTTFPIAADQAETLVGLAVSMDQKQAAAIEPDGGGLWLLPLDRTTTELRIEGRAITSASFDVDGTPWFTQQGTIRRVVTGDETEEVPVTTRGIGPITTVQLGRDGTQAALIAGGVLHVGIVPGAWRRAGGDVGAAGRLDCGRGPRRRLAGRSPARRPGRLEHGAPGDDRLRRGGRPRSSDRRLRRAAASPRAPTVAAGAEAAIYLTWACSGAGRTPVAAWLLP